MKYSETVRCTVSLDSVPEPVLPHVLSDDTTTLTHEILLSWLNVTNRCDMGAMLLALQKHVPFQM